MNQALKPIPQFNSEDQERDFWATHDMVEYMQEVTEPVQFRNLKPSTETISLRLPKSLLDRIRTEALKRDVPYQSYMKVKLSEIFGFRERVA